MASQDSFNDFDKGVASLDFGSLIKLKPEKEPQLIVIYGKGGSGKTSMATYCEDPIILPAGRETGHERMHCHKMPNAHDMNMHPSDHVFAALKWLIATDHTRKTVIIDNLGAIIESFNHKLEEEHKGTDLKSYGKGTVLLNGMLSRFLAGIYALMKKKGCNVILIAHDSSYSITNADGTYFTRVSVNAPNASRELIEQRCHGIYYITAEIPTISTKNAFGVSKKIGSSGNVSRVIYTRATGAYFAKTRASVEEFYDIDDSPNEEELLEKKTNDSIIKFWSDVFK